MEMEIDLSEIKAAKEGNRRSPPQTWRQDQVGAGRC